MAIQLNHVTDTISASSANGVNIISKLSLTGTTNIANSLLVTGNTMAYGYSAAKNVYVQGGNNYLKYSQDFATGGIWLPNDTPSPTKTNIAPDGTATAYSWAFNTVLTGYYTSPSIPVYPNTTYTISVYVKYISGSAPLFRFGSDSSVWLGSTTTSQAYVNFNPQTKTFSGATTAALNYGYQDVGNDWSRVWITATTNNSATTFAIINYISTAGTLAVWGAQLEPGLVPGAYVATTSSTVTTGNSLEVQGRANITGDVYLTSNLVVGNSGVLAPLTVVARPANTNVAIRIVSDTTSTRFAEIRKADAATTFYSGLAEDLYITSGRRNFFTSVGGAWGSSFGFSTTIPQTYAADGTGTYYIDMSGTWAPVSGNGFYRHIYLYPTINQAANTKGDYAIIHGYAQETAAYGANNRLIDMGTGATRRFAVSNTGSIFSAGSANIMGDLFVSGNVTLGDASTDTITLNGSTISLGNNQNFDAGTLFIDAVNNRVGIGTTSLSGLQAGLQVGPKVIDDNNLTYDGNTFMVIQQTPTSTTVLNDPKTVMTLARQGTGSQAYGAAVTFDLSRYENSGVNSRTRLDIKLANGSFLTQNTVVMTMLSSGNVGIGTTSPAYTLQVNGAFAANTKSFVIDHPLKPDMKLRYGSLEGPENGVYVRGRTKELVIRLPDYWTGLVDESSITVNITPVGHHQHLYVRKIQDNLVYVSSDSETFREIDYFYTVYAERKDVEKLVVEF